MKPFIVVVSLLLAAGSVFAQVEIETACTSFQVSITEPEEDAECVVWLQEVTEDGAYVVEIIGVNLREAELSGMMLNDMDLIGADLREADLSNAYLDNALLQSANLSNANLSDAVLLNTNLSGANLSDANLKGAVLTCAIMPNGKFASAEDAERYEAIVDDFDCSLLNSDE